MVTFVGLKDVGHSTNFTFGIRIILAYNRRMSSQQVSQSLLGEPTGTRHPGVGLADMDLPGWMVVAKELAR